MFFHSIFFSRYKILFLDVLFPLSVKKIIYVDADQIVRADLRELAELDLHGAPYGCASYPPSSPPIAYTSLLGSLPSVTTSPRWTASGSGSRVSGKIISATDLTTSLPFTWLTLLAFVAWVELTSCGMKWPLRRVGLFIIINNPIQCYIRLALS